MQPVIEKTFQDEEEDRSALPLQLDQTFDRYKVEAWIGQGGCATVYKIRHQKLNITRAIKILQPSTSDTQKRFINEGRLQAQWHHENIVRVHDALLVESRPALILDFIDGLPLHQHMNVHGPNFEHITDLFIGILRGVQHAHNNGIIHRDLKPSNILVASAAKGFVPKVTDFGIAKHLHNQSLDQPKTKTDALMGTPNYMAPEQIRHTHPITTQTDIFSLGTILYEMCCGARPFDEEDTLQLLNNIASVKYRRPQKIRPDIPPVLSSIIRQCLQLEPTRRFDSCQAIIELLEPAPTTQPSGHSTTLDTIAPRHSARKSIVRVLMTVGSMVVVVLGYMLYKKIQRTNLARVYEIEAIRNLESDPARALALLRSSYHLDPTKKHALNQLDIRSKLTHRGAHVHTMPMPDEIIDLTHLNDERTIAITKDHYYIINAKTGQHQVIKNLPNKNDKYNAIEHSPDGKFVVSFTLTTNPSDHEHPTLINTDSAKFITPLPHPEQTGFVIFPSNDRIIIGSKNTLTLWDTKGNLLNTKHFKHPIFRQCVDWSGTREHAVVFRINQKDPNQTLMMYLNTKTLNIDKVYALDIKSTQSTCMAKFQDKNNMLYWFNNSTISKINTHNYTVQAIHSGFPVQQLTMSLDKTHGRVTIGGHRHPFALYDRTLRTLGTFEGHTASVRHAHLYSHSALAITSSYDRTLGIFSQNNGKRLDTLRGHKDWILVSRLDNNPQAPAVWSGGRDHTIKKWSLSHYPQHLKQITFPKDIIKWRWSDDGKLLVLITSDKQIHIWRRNNPSDIQQLVHGGNAFQRPVITKNHFILSHSGKIHVYTRNTLRRIYKIEGITMEQPQQVAGGIMYMNVQRTASHLVWKDPKQKKADKKITIPCKIVHQRTLPNGKNLIMQCEGGDFYRIDKQSLVVSKLPNAHLPTGSTFTNNPITNKSLFGAWSGKSILMKNNTLGFQKAHQHTDAITHALSAKKLPWFVTADLDGHINLIDANNGRLIKQLGHSAHGIVQMRLANNDRTLAILLRNKTMRIIDIPTSTTTQTITLTIAGRDFRFKTPQQIDLLDHNFSFWKIQLDAKVQPPLLTKTGPWSNHRTCKGTTQVVPVIPFPKPDSIWAPQSLCGAKHGHKKTK